MHKHIIWSPLSEADFDQILNYLNINWDNKVANQFIDLIENLINQISENPKQFLLINKKKGIRKVVLTKQNSLFYRVSKDHIDILRIYDTRQDPHRISFK